MKRPFKEFDADMRQHEVPLNFLLNAFFRFSSRTTIESILNQYRFSSSELASKTLELKFPSETKLTQPDVLIESDEARVFIEVKVDSKVRLEQVQKYALLHRPSGRRIEIAVVEGFRSGKRARPMSNRLDRMDVRIERIERRLDLTDA